MSIPELYPEVFSLHPSCYEKELFSKGLCHVAGTDEVGRGCLAGPVVAAAVILPKNHGIHGIKDSKLLSAAQREKLSLEIKAIALSYAVSEVSPAEIDLINIFQASLKAMVIAVQQLKLQPEILLIDGKFRVPMALPQKPVIKGDLHCQAIGAASILAKVARDQKMKEFEMRFPAYSFSLHKGYPTPQHRREIKEHGPSPIHRMSFKLLKEEPE